MELFDLESKPRHGTVANFAPQTRRESHIETTETNTFPSEWAPALRAANNALTAFRDATAHRGDTPSVEALPADDAPDETIRNWITDVRRIIAKNPAGRILLGDMQVALHSPTATAAYLNRVADEIAAFHEMNKASGQRGTRSWALPKTTADVVPAWTSRRAWLAQVEYALSTEIGSATCKDNKTTAETVLHHAAIYAHHVDSATGRGLTASRKTITAQTGMSPKVEQRVRRVLNALELVATAAVGRTLSTLEYLAAALHHGSSQSRAASTLHLTTPKQFAHIRPKPTKRLKNRTNSTKNRRVNPSEPARTGGSDRDHLSPTGISPDEVFSLDVNHQTHASARGRSESTNETPRPLHLQRAAAELLAKAPGLGKVAHIGSICHVLTSAGIDTTSWSGADIAAEINRDTQRRGWIWPAEISDPVAFLAWRLRRISWTGTSPSTAARLASERRQHDRAVAAAATAERDLNAATESTRRSAVNFFRAACASKVPASMTQPARASKFGRRSGSSASHQADSLARAAARAEIDARRVSPADAILGAAATF